MKKLINRFKEEFFKALDEKPSWGKDQIKVLFIQVLSNVLLSNADAN